MRAKEFINENWRKKINEQEAVADLPKLDKLPDVSPPEGSSLWSKAGKALAPVGRAISKVAPWIGGAEIARSLYNKDIPGAYLGAAQMVPHPAVSIPAIAADVAKSTQVDDPDSWLSQLPFRNLGPQGGATPVSQWATSSTTPAKQEVSGKIKPAAAPTQAATAKPSGEYEVKPGDSLSKIAARAGLSNWQDLYQKNIDVVGSNPNLIYPGQKLKIPKPSETTSRAPKPTSGIRQGPNPNIDPETRKRALDWAKTPPSERAQPADQNTTGMASSGARHAAELNNPTGLGWDPKNRTWQAFKTPEEGVAATQRQLSQYLSGKGYMRGVAPTPENVVSMWVTGGATPAEKIQGGSYLQSVKNELSRAGVRLGPNGEIPNSPEATLAITRAMTKHETDPRYQKKFQSALYPESPTQAASRT